MNSPSIMKNQQLADGAGLFASIACAIHCAAMPLLIGYLPMLGLSWLADESFHQVMAAVCFILALLAFLPGWRKHRSLTPAGIGLAGLGLLAVAAFALEGECCSACATSSQNLEQSCADAQYAQGVTVEPKPALIRNSLASKAIPLFTPFGGLLLVVGHLANHRKSCRCSGDSCCLPPAADTVEAG